jgi:hypothetical protein
MPEMTKLTPPEKTRVYVFPGQDRAVFHDITAIAVSERGTHRLEARGGKYIVQPGWLYIKLDVDDWTL